MKRKDKVPFYICPGRGLRTWREIIVGETPGQHVKSVHLWLDRCNHGIKCMEDAPLLRTENTDLSDGGISANLVAKKIPEKNQGGGRSSLVLNEGREGK